MSGPSDIGPPCVLFGIVYSASVGYCLRVDFTNRVEQLLTGPFNLGDVETLLQSIVDVLRDVIYRRHDEVESANVGLLGFTFRVEAALCLHT